MKPAIQLTLRHGDRVMNTLVPQERALKVGRKVRLIGDDARLWLIEAMYPAGEADFEPRQYIYCGFGL